VRFAEIFVAPREVHAAGDDAENVIGRLPRAHDRLLVIFDEGAVELQLGDELLVHPGQQTVPW
jgi:hypothetical protein